MRLDGAKTFNPGLARHQVTWQEKSVTGQDSYGRDECTWADVVSVKARITAMQGRELEAARQTWAEARYKIEHQYYAGITRAMRGKWWDGTAYRYLNILDVQDAPGMARVTTIICSEATD